VITYESSELYKLGFTDANDYDLLSFGNDALHHITFCARELQVIHGFLYELVTFNYEQIKSLSRKV